MKNVITYISALALIIVFGLSVSCKKSSTTTPASSSTPPANEVWMQNTAFNPVSITITVNTTVKWTNKDGFAHTVTSDSSLFDSGSIGSGGIYSHQFTAVGTYPYHCTFHVAMGMRGTVIVH